MDSVVPSTPALLVGWAVSIALLVASLIVVAAPRHGRTSFSRRAWLLAAGVYLSAFALKGSQYLAGLKTSSTPLVHSILAALHMMGSGNDPSLNMDLAASALGGIAQVYVHYDAILYLIAPAAAITAVVTFFSRVLALPLLRWRSSRADAYVFSEVSASSLDLAESVVRTCADEGRRCVLAFAGGGDATEKDAERAQVLDALVSNLDIIQLSRWCSLTRPANFVVFEDDEQHCLKVAEQLSSELLARLEAKTSLASPTIAFLSSSEGGGMLVDSLAARTSREGVPPIHYRRVDSTYAAVCSLVDELPLFLDGVPGDGSAAESLYASGERCVLVAGVDEVGYAFLKLALWCARAWGVSFQVHVADPAAGRVRERLASECPELLGAEGATPAFFHECCVTSAAMRDLIVDEVSPTYVLVAQGDDLKNAAAARWFREMIEQRRLLRGDEGHMPVVCTRIADSALARSVRDATTAKGQPYRISVFGDGGRELSYGRFFSPRLERMSRNLNRAYWGCYEGSGADRATLAQADCSLERYEYNRRSSEASAIFLKNDLFSFCRLVEAGEIPGDFALPSREDWALRLDAPALAAAIDAYDAYVSSQDHEWLLRLEHDRWAAYVRSLGFASVGGEAFERLFAETGGSQDQRARLHVCLVPFDELDEVDALVERVQGAPVRMPFKQVDDVVVRHLAQIVRDK